MSDLDPAAAARSIRSLRRQRAIILTVGDRPQYDHRRIASLIATSSPFHVHVATMHTRRNRPESRADVTVTYRLPYRNTSAVAPGQTNDPVVDTLPDLASLIRQRIDTLDPMGALVTIESLVPLLTEYGNEQVCALLSALRRACPPEDGCVLAHLPVQPNQQSVHPVAAVCQAIVELQLDDTILEHRWRFPARAVKTDWFPLDGSEPF